ncbi:MAG: ATP-binding cassette domain-containing protein [Thermoleophilia bacterium]|nr:ATP-binding cassette domain-containing protein [Thermoleophilia bacterium]
MRMLVDMNNITVLRGETRVFAGLTLQVEEGCNTAILGPNGAGKSTLLKLISGELRPVFSPGSHVKILGRERWNVWDLRSHLGVVSHDLQHEYLASALGIDVVLSGFYSSVDTWQHQVFGDEERRRAEEILDMLEIGALRERPFGRMSTGQQRRFLLGRALVHRPGTLLLDEPTSGLDLKAAFHYTEVLSGLMRGGTTVLLVTHRVQEIPPEIQRVVLLKEGRVLAEGSREDTLTSEMLSELFDYPLHAALHNGTCQVFPAVMSGTGKRGTP